MHKVETRPGIWIAYEDDWFGKPWSVPETVVMVHGNSESSRAWVSWVCHLADKYRVVRLDLPGFGASNAAHGFPEQDDKRKALNEFIRTSGLFDGVIDFDKATLDPQTGGLKAEFVPESTTGGPGDKLHPNRTGYLAMGMAIDLDLFTPRAQGRR